MSDSSAKYPPFQAHVGVSCWRVETEQTVWLYDPVGGGFASVLDADGNDWIQFSHAEGPSGIYRGIPNMVHRTGQDSFFHPGYVEANACKSEWLEPAELGVIATIRSTTERGFSVRWDFFPKGARCTVEAVDPNDPNYWFLYEGTPGGEWAPDTCTRSTSDTDSSSADLNERWEETFASGWVAFSAANGRTLAVAAELPQPVVHSYYPMEPMTVFGFGRKLDSLDKGINVPAVFSVCLGENKEAATAKAKALLEA